MRRGLLLGGALGGGGGEQALPLSLLRARVVAREEGGRGVDLLILDNCLRCPWRGAKAVSILR